MRLPPSSLHVSVCVVTHRQNEERVVGGLWDKGPGVPTNASVAPEDRLQDAAGTRPIPQKTFLGSEQERESGLFPPLAWPFARPWTGPHFDLSPLSVLRLHLTNTPPPPSPRISTSHMIMTPYHFYLNSLPGAPSHPDGLSKRSLIFLLAFTVTLPIGQLSLPD